MAVMAGMPDNSIDTIITDPPYGLGFMGVKWDTYAHAKGGGIGTGKGFENCKTIFSPQASPGGS